MRSASAAHPAISPTHSQEATAAGIENRRLYFRTINDKANLQPPVEKSDWFKLVSVNLGNSEGDLPGDQGFAGPKIDPSRWLELGSWLEQFHRQIPAVVYSSYPPR